MAPEPRQSPQIHLEVVPDNLRLAAGEGGVYLAVLENRTQEAQQQAVSVEGLPDGWYRIDFNATVRAFPGERRNATLIVSVPRDAEPGGRAFRVRASAGAAESAVSCSLEVTAAEDGAVGDTRTSDAGREREAEAPKVTPPADVDSAVRPADAGAPLPPAIALAPRETFRFEAPGVAAQAVLTVQNRSRLIARYEISVEGLPPDWYNITTPEPRLEPGGSVQIPIRISPRTRPGYPAGDYDFRIRVTLYGYPEAFAEVDGGISIAGSSSFDAHMSPMQSTGREGEFVLSLNNTGDVPASLRLDASDVAGGCHFEFPREIELEPWEEKDVRIKVGAHRNGLMGGAQAFHVQLQVRAEGGPSTAARILNVRFVHKPLLSVPMAALALLLVVGATAGAIAFAVLDPFGGDGEVVVVAPERTVPVEVIENTPVPVETEAPAPSDCRIQIRNPLVSLHRDPGVFSQQIIRVPPGTYEVTDFETLNIPGGTERWLEITAAGRTGWVRDDTITVEAKSPGCP